jgi:hypothetical protein
MIAESILPTKGEFMSDFGAPPPPPSDPPPPSGPPPSGPGGPYGPPGGSYGPGGPYGGGGYPSQGTPGGPPPQNYLVWAILTTLFCCLPLGVASIVFSTQVNSKWQAGDYAGAQEASGRAKNFALWSALSTIIIFVLIFAFVIVAGVLGSSGS